MPLKNFKTTNWVLPEPIFSNILNELNISEAVKAILLRRGIKSLEEATEIIKPKELPDPLDHFPQLSVAINKLEIACKANQQVGICGDYDADGMTSTALLTSALKAFGAKPIPSIPIFMASFASSELSILASIRTLMLSDVNGVFFFRNFNFLSTFF